MSDGAFQSGQNPLMEAAGVFAVQGLYGLIWLNGNLTISARFGRLTEFVQVGDAVTKALPVLYGYEPDLAALTKDRKRIFSLPAVKINSPAGASPRLDITISSKPAGDGLIVLLARVPKSSPVEIELSRQMRARLIAEEEVARKSRELAQLNAELERANRDLEDYAAVISHDLKSPLRAIGYMADDIDTALETNDRTSLAQTLSELRTQSRRMSGMLSALLEYASIGRKTDIIEEVDTRQLISAIVKSLPAKPGLAVTVSGDWPKIETIRAPLDLVLRNLIDNAIKHHHRDQGTIEIGADVEQNDGDRCLRISVSDDGPGMDQKHHDTALLPFRTLSAGDNPNSTGMGLAMVRRTLDAVGASLIIKSDPAVRAGTVMEIRWPFSEPSR